MFVRVTGFQSTPDRIDGMGEQFKQTVMTSFAQVRGFLGGVVLVNRDTGAGHSVTHWEDADCMRASEETADSLRSNASQIDDNIRIGDLDRLEILVEHRVAEPRPGSFVRVNDVHGSPSRIDDVARMLRERSSQISPAGVRSLIMAANRETGRIVVTTSWETAAERDASEAAIREIRQEGTELAGAEPARVELYEAVFVDVKQAALV
jgi:heme-degrading monooxygenase HmoA